VAEMEEEVLSVLVLADAPAEGEADSIVNRPRVVVKVAVEDMDEDGRVVLTGSAGVETLAWSSLSSGPAAPEAAESNGLMAPLTLPLRDSFTGAMEDRSTAEERVLGLLFWKASLASSPSASSQAEPLRESALVLILLPLLLSMVVLFLYFRFSSLLLLSRALLSPSPGKAAGCGRGYGSSSCQVTLGKVA